MKVKEAGFVKLMCIQSLRRVASLWLNSDYPLRQQSLAQAADEFCLSVPSFKMALDWIFNQWTEKKLTEIFSSNPYQKHRRVVQILAGNTPAVIAQGLLQAVILALPQSIKLPNKQSTFAKLLYQSFVENGVPLPEEFELDTWQDKLPELYARMSQADLVLAYGSDETMTALKKELPATAKIIDHGHAESAAVLFKEAIDRKELEKLAYDFLSYDQRGCLSPRVTFIEEGGILSPQDCANIFAEEVLPPLAFQLPRGGLFPGEAAEILHQRNRYGFYGEVYRSEDWTVCYTENQAWPLLALPRFMIFVPFKSSAFLMEMLRPIKDSLISLGCAGEDSKLLLLRQNLNVRISALGEMQKQLLVF